MSNALTVTLSTEKFSDFSLSDIAPVSLPTNFNVSAFSALMVTFSAPPERRISIDKGPKLFGFNWTSSSFTGPALAAGGPAPALAMFDASPPLRSIALAAPAMKSAIRPI